MPASDYEYITLIGDCDTFTLKYLPKGGKPQTMRLDAEDEANARFEAANCLQISEDELPETEWH